MATSGNTSWELASLDIVNAAYRKLNYVGIGQTISPQALANGTEALNGLIAWLATKGMPLWKRITLPEVLSTTSQIYTIDAGVKVAQVVLNNTGGSRYPLVEKSLYDFNMLPSNAGPGVPVHYTVQPTIAGTTISLWPYTSDTTTAANAQIIVEYQKKFDGVFSPTDTLDFPSYWDLPITYQLAVLLAPESGLPLQDRSNLKMEADELMKSASDYGDEDGSLFVQPDYFARGAR